MSAQFSPQLAANLSTEQYANFKNVIKLEEQIAQFTTRLEMLKKQYTEALTKIQPVLITPIIPPTI